MTNIILVDRWIEVFRKTCPEIKDVSQEFLTGMFALAEDCVRNEDELLKEYAPEIEAKE